MYNNDTELIFPSRVMEALEDLRGEEWEALVVRVRLLPEDDPEHLAFVLLMAGLNGCNSCNSDSFRAMRGCTQCSIQNIRRFRSSDKELIKKFEKAKKDFPELTSDNANIMHYGGTRFNGTYGIEFTLEREEIPENYQERKVEIPVL